MVRKVVDNREDMSMRYVINTLIDYPDRYVVEDHADLGDQTYWFGNSIIMAHVVRLWLLLTR